MATVATLTADPASATLSDTLMRRAADAVGGTVAVLAEGIACDITMEHQADSRQTIAAALADAPVDINIHDSANRRKTVLLADMDSTMIQQECLDELAAAAGRGSEVAAVTARAMRGEIDFEPALEQRVATLAGQPVSLIEDVLATRISLMPGGPALLATMRANGAHCVLVSGGFTDFTSDIAAKLGFHEHHANQFETDSGTLTGKVVPPILGRDAKVSVLEATTARLGLTDRDVLAVGDGANDLGMIGRAGMGVALHGKPAVAAAAPFRIDHGDLTALLYLQGYSAAEIVEPS